MRVLVLDIVHEGAKHVDPDGSSPDSDRRVFRADTLHFFPATCVCSGGKRLAKMVVQHKFVRCSIAATDSIRLCCSRKSRNARVETLQQFPGNRKLAHAILRSLRRWRLVRDAARPGVRQQGDGRAARRVCASPLRSSTIPRFFASGWRASADDFEASAGTVSRRCRCRERIVRQSSLRSGAYSCSVGGFGYQLAMQPIRFDQTAQFRVEQRLHGSAGFSCEKPGAPGQVTTSCSASKVDGASHDRPPRSTNGRFSAQGCVLHMNMCLLAAFWRLENSDFIWLCFLRLRSGGALALSVQQRKPLHAPGAGSRR